MPLALKSFKSKRAPLTDLTTLSQSLATLMSIIGVLPLEILCEILQLSSCDVDTLYRCTLVCSSFKEAALPNLYRTITLKTLTNSETGGVNFGALQTLDKYPYLRSYVRSAPKVPKTYGFIQLPSFPMWLPTRCAIFHSLHLRRVNFFRYRTN
ncbi:hypothetical protein BDP27DRAFT_1028640 [Rhodocollybia butyracea]|uniref:F-box domain-containing protein n=1 Tax=Rhodocollybia butyracea TaxID=206335 RepID=A0A9P5UDP0_9AGAR|nr:hypothetical protein BDP27DRAFT_1028640 [Rhodocollybia butyracea]